MNGIFPLYLAGMYNEPLTQTPGRISRAMFSTR